MRIIAAPPIDPETLKKSYWRHWARAQRSTLDLPVISAAIRNHLADWLQRHPPTTVVTYLSLAQEVDVADLSGHFGHGWATTRTPQRGPLTIHILDTTLEKHRYGFLQPLATAAVVAPAEVGVVLVPGLAFDRAGGRLGRGAGYYDGLLTTLRPATFIGVSPASLVVAKLPMQEHDVPMDLLVTERGITAVEVRRSSREDLPRDEGSP